ncbi:MAG: hypothetical protein ISS41_09845 [Candidatus Aminicenantes bacterium]|nr:hypothetical protein [Candidatus Aminicenantes bacterium]MBL7083913.1 hypothetical protein [Candidatus Aminicenantes bacterium]
MERSEILSKLIALKNNLSKFLKSKRSRFFDPKNVLDLFHRYLPVRDELLSNYASLFSDIPKRETPKPSKTTEFDGRGYIRRVDLQMLLNDVEYCIDILTNMPSVDIPSMKVSREGIFFAGQYFDALSKAEEILSEAEKSIWIIDGYIGPDVLNLLASKKSSVEAKILTNDVPAPVKTAADAFNKQYKNLSIRTSQAFHDRFIIIDDAEFYHFGASIKDLGNRGFMFSRIEESQIIDALRTKWTEEWGKANPII